MSRRAREPDRQVEMFAEQPAGGAGGTGKESDAAGLRSPASLLKPEEWAAIKKESAAMDRLFAGARKVRAAGVRFSRHQFGVTIVGGRWQVREPERCVCPVGALLAAEKAKAVKFGKDSRGAYVTARADAADLLGVPLRRLDAFIAGFDGTASPTSEPEQAAWVAAGRAAYAELVGGK